MRSSTTVRKRSGCAALFLVAVVLHDDTFTIQPKRWRFDRFITSRQLPVEVDCRFQAAAGLPVRAELVTEENLTAKLHHRPYEAIASSSDGTLQYQIGVPGSFAIVISNEDTSRAAEVSLRFALDTSPVLPGFPRSLSIGRKLTVIVLSLLGFLVIVSFSGWKLLQAIRTHQNRKSDASDSGM